MSEKKEFNEKSKPESISMTPNFKERVLKLSALRKRKSFSDVIWVVLEEELQRNKL